MRSARRLSAHTAVAALTAVLLTGLTGTPASTVQPARATRPSAAASMASGTAGVACRAGTARPADAQARVTRGRGEPSYSLRRLRRIDRRLHRRLRHRGLAAGAPGSARFGLLLRIPVHAHVVDGRARTGPSRLRVRRQIRVLNEAYSGGESSNNTATRFRFYLASYERVHNERWHTASMFDHDDRQLRRALHVGGPDELNLYFAAPVDKRTDSVVLGWSSVPWRARRQPRLDGVTVHQRSLPGGSLRGYNRGDTAVHEIGHWLGLFHTFEGGCSKRNDRVDDTPAEASPSTRCVHGRDTCDAPGLDPVHNFMDYSFDSCMNMFTPGQVSRMTDNWLAYRTP